MKNLFCTLIGLLLFSCSTDDSQENNNPVPSAFSINAVTNNAVINVDDEVTITVTSNENMMGIVYSFDNFVTEGNLYSNFGTSKALKFTFDKVGTTTIYFKALNQNNEESAIKTVSITVNRGNAIKIVNFQVNSFSGINTSWDQEYPSSNSNSLADVVFGFNKSKIGNPFNATYNYGQWYTSAIKMNQGDLTWNVSTEELYIQPEKTIRMGLVDNDGDVAQDLMMGPPDYRDFNFSSYLSTKPNSVTFSYPEINLEFVVTIEWPN